MIFHIANTIVYMHTWSLRREVYQSCLRRSFVISSTWPTIMYSYTIHQFMEIMEGGAGGLIKHYCYTTTPMN